MSAMSRRLSLVLIVLFSIPASAFAWGTAGHIIVARIAEDRLSPEAKQKIAALLKADETESRHASISDPYIPNWPDLIKKSNNTGPWHYVDIPLEGDDYDPNRDCIEDDATGKKGCLVGHLKEQIAILSNRALEPRDRERALKYVIHFVGDIHQPLHCSEFNKDRGGNDRHINFAPSTQPINNNLHSLWDTLLIIEALGHDRSQDNVLKYADALASKVDADSAKEWLKLKSPEEWAVESHAVAKSVVYKGIAADKTIVLDITPDYVKETRPVIDAQLTKAGVRLADVLEKALQDAPTTVRSTP